MGPTMAVVAAACLVCMGAVGEEPVVKQPTETSEWNVMDFGAVADGVADNTAAFQTALDAAGAAGGGIVLAPGGRYSFNGNLVAPKDVTLRGTYAYAPAHAGIRDKSAEKPEFGTVLMPRGGAGAEDGPPFLQLNTNSAVQGLTLYYPDQNPEGPVPTPYPYAIAMRGNNPAVLDVQLLNPYNGIDASKNQRALIRNVHGQPLHIGLYVDSIYDVGRIENVHWNPWWSMAKDLFEWQKTHGTGFIFGKSDWHYVLNTFCFGYNVGYQFIATPRGSTNGNFLGIGADDCRTAVLIEESAPMGILITNGEFVSIDGPDPTMVRVMKTHTGTVRFSNCAFWGPCNRIVAMEGPGTIGFNDCTFVQWSRRRAGCHAIEAQGGSLLVRGCEFKDDQAQILLGKGVSRAIITDNLLQGRRRIVDRAKGKTVIKDNVPTEKRGGRRPAAQE